MATQITTTAATSGNLKTTIAVDSDKKN